MQRDNKFSAMDSAKGAVALRELTLGSLFDGIGGFCYAATLTGRIKPIWVGEIEPRGIGTKMKTVREEVHVEKDADKTNLGRRDRAELYRHNKVSLPGSNARWKCDGIKRE